LTFVYVYATVIHRRTSICTEATVMGSKGELVELVRSRYAAAALSVQATGAPAKDCGCGAGECNCAGSCCGPSGNAIGSDAAAEAGEGFGAVLYSPGERDGLPEEAVLASLGCGNPTAVADLREGEVVLDLGSGGGIDVLLSARRVGPTGKAYGLDMTDEMLDLARRNARQAGATNVEFLRGHIENIPLPGESVDVVISNCVVNLSTDKPAVLAEIARVLRPGGRIGISDVVADNQLSIQDRAARGSHVGCIAGALTFTEYTQGLTAAGLTNVSLTATHEVTDGMHGAIIRATKPIPAGCC
jgi:SAM-dependent methyltransferase